MSVDIQVLASGSSGNCYAVDDGSSKIMIDAGVPWKRVQQKLGFKTSGICALLLGHEHSDHAGYISQALRAAIDVYTSGGTASALGLSGHRVHIIKPREAFTVGSFTVLPFQVEHDAAEPLGFVLNSSVTDERLLYLTDSVYSRYTFSGCSRILLECNYALDILNENVKNGTVDMELKKRIIKSHMSLQTVKDLLEANDLSRVEAIYLIHLSDQNSCAERFKREIMELTGKPVIVA